MPVSTRGSRRREQIKAQESEARSISQLNLDMLCRAAQAHRQNSEPSPTPEQAAYHREETIDHTDDTMSSISSTSTPMSREDAAMCLTQMSSSSEVIRFSPEHEGTYIFSTTQDVLEVRGTCETTDDTPRKCDVVVSKEGLVWRIMGVCGIEKIIVCSRCFWDSQGNPSLHSESLNLLEHYSSDAFSAVEWEQLLFRSQKQAQARYHCSSHVEHSLCSLFGLDTISPFQLTVKADRRSLLSTPVLNHSEVISPQPLTHRSTQTPDPPS